MELKETISDLCPKIAAVKKKSPTGSHMGRQGLVASFAPFLPSDPQARRKDCLLESIYYGIAYLNYPSSRGAVNQIKREKPHDK